MGQVVTSFSDLSSPVLKEIFQKYWNTPLKEYSKHLTRKKKVPKIEKELLNSFKLEFHNIGLSKEEVRDALNFLETSGSIQTSHHVTPTSGPGFTCIDLITLSSLPKDDPYIIGAFSGVPFSNNAWSGSLSYGSIELEQFLKPGSALLKRAHTSLKESVKHGSKNKRVSLIPAKYRDSLVYSYERGEYQDEISHDIISELEKALLFQDKNKRYTHWACRVNRNIQEQVFNRKKIYNVDINNIVKHYLLEVLKNKSHPIYQIFFDSKLSGKVFKKFSDLPVFRIVKKGKKSLKVRPAFWNTGKLISEQSLNAETPEQLIELLETNVICPGQWLLFFILVFLNGLQCLGSFNQVEYLQNYCLKLQDLQSYFPLQLDSFENKLTTGRLIDEGSEVWPFDYLILGKKIDIDSYQDRPMNTFWQKTLDSLQLK